MACHSIELYFSLKKSRTKPDSAVGGLVVETLGVVDLFIRDNLFLVGENDGVRAVGTGVRSII
uniref:Uncharacterized protein n=1 Tax=Romanomermis culicivorax TaxID=13658 RepID=A0A915KDN0_ROMCU